VAIGVDIGIGLDQGLDLNRGIPLLVVSNSDADCDADTDSDSEYVTHCVRSRKARSVRAGGADPRSGRSQ
jgi:hypothetical protein